MEKSTRDFLERPNSRKVPISSAKNEDFSGMYSSPKNLRNGKGDKVNIAKTHLNIMKFAGKSRDWKTLSTNQPLTTANKGKVAKINFDPQKYKNVKKSYGPNCDEYDCSNLLAYEDGLELMKQLESIKPVK